MEKSDKYSKLLKEGGLFFYGPSKGSFILPPYGFALWKNIQNVLDKKFASRGVQNVLLPTLIPLSLLEKEKKHIAGFSPECFYVEKIGEKKIETPLVLRPTSEVLFYEWYRQTLKSYQQLPFLYNQWCPVFRAEKNTAPFFRNTEFLWQEGHTLHYNTEEAQQFALSILSDYQDYAEKTLCVGIIIGKKTEGEKFAGALETYTIECLLPDGQCLQLATSHYFGDHFCRLLEVKYQDKDNQFRFPYSTSWGTSTRALGAIVKTHADKEGLILPFAVAPVQIAFILIGEEKELINYYQEVSSLLTLLHFRCQLYNKSSQVVSNIFQANKEGCPLKIILGPEELEKREIALFRRDNTKQKITIKLDGESELEKKTLSLHEDYAEKTCKLHFPHYSSAQLAEEKTKIVNQIKKGTQSRRIFQIISQQTSELSQTLYRKSTEFRNSHIYKIESLSELEKGIKEGKIGLFLVPFCNDLDCEKKIREKTPSYSVRCIALEEKNTGISKCLFCQSFSQNRVYLGRSY